MQRFHTVKLEFIRPGPAHNQLLSPLTPYMALCGEGSPVTFHIDLEHHQLLSRLERLRYFSASGTSTVRLPNRVRESTVAEVGGDVERIYAKLQTLLAEEWKAVGASAARAGDPGDNMIHLRLVLSGSELSMIPFEMAVAPEASPGGGLEFLLQFQMPIVVTRETRWTRSLKLGWDEPREPKILVVAAEPAGMTVPLKAHVQALRESLGPWIRHPKSRGGKEDTPEEKAKRRLEYVKERLRVLPNASIESIYELCSQEDFTHVHVLAHGAHLEFGGETRFGVALCRQDRPSAMEVVSGKRLAKALQAESRDAARRSLPLVVTLATCDSGNVNTVLVPGGSLAHDLHTAGIPWVFASQFPLTKVGSVKMTSALYPRLLRGDDPRRALYEVRRLLFMRAERDHDWASLVAYATVPADFDEEVSAFFESQTKRAIDRCLELADDDGTPVPEVDKALARTEELLELWRSRLPEGDEIQHRTRRAEFYGMCGSTRKRISLLHARRKQGKESEQFLKSSLSSYREAMEQWAVDRSKHHWVSTQALSLTAILEGEPEPVTQLLAEQLAQRDVEQGQGATKAWGHGTLAELEMLAPYHLGESRAADEEKVRSHCRSIIAISGPDSFEVFSTRRQFERYLKHWKHERWVKVAEAAVDALTPADRSTRSRLLSH